MPEHLLAVVAAPGRDVPAHVTGLLMPLDVEVVGMQLSHPPGSDLWWIQLSVRAPSPARVELLVKRLNRLVDVLRVVPPEPGGHRRQSVYVRLRPETVALGQIGETGAVVPRGDARTVHRGVGAAPDRRARSVRGFRVDAPSTRGSRSRDRRGFGISYRRPADEPAATRNGRASFVYLATGFAGEKDFYD
jgi:acetolactate synthase-1/3 small subunit